MEQLNTHNIKMHFQDSNSKAYKMLLGKSGYKILFVIYDHNFLLRKIYVYICPTDYHIFFLRNIYYIYLLSITLSWYPVDTDYLNLL